MTKWLSSVLIASTFLSPLAVWAEDVKEIAGEGIGLTVGNTIMLPAKAASVGVGLAAGVFSFIFTLGDTEVARQIWRNSTEPPFLITPSVARQAVGERPELQEKAAPPMKD